MKKLLLFILLVMMQPMTILADERVAIDGIKYDLVSNSKQAVVISFDNGKYKGDVVIPSSVNYYGVTYNVTRIGDGAFQNCTELTSVKLPSNITDLGLYSFSGCTRLISVNIPSKVSYIGNYAFDGCISLKSISFSNVNIITDGMFRGCTSLTSITIPNIVKEIRDEAFFGCSNITSITIPQNVTSIGEKVFGGCVNLASINVSSENATYDSRNSCNAIIEKSSKTLITGCKSTKIPSSVTSIGNDAFYNCSSLTGITIPNSITTIGHNAFNSCGNLKKVTLPSSLTEIGNNVFSNCNNLSAIISHIQVPFDVDENVFYSNSSATLYVPEGTKAAYEALNGWNKFADIVEGELYEETVDGVIYSYNKSAQTATVVGGDFSDYRKVTILGSVLIDGVDYAVKTIASGAFRNNYYIDSLIISSGIEVIEKNAFYNCYRMRYVELPSTLTTIGEYAFAYCGNMQNLVLPSSLTSIGEFAFTNNNLTNVTSRIQSPFEINKSVFCRYESYWDATEQKNVETYTNPNATLYVPIGTKSAYEAIEGWSVFPEIVEGEIKETTYNGLNYRYVEGKGEATVISGDYSQITKLTIPGSIEVEGVSYIVKAIDNYVFSNCYSLDTLIIENGVERIGQNAFYNCSNMKSVSLPTSLKSIGESSFAECNNITSLVIPEGVKTIGQNAFSWCNNMKLLELPSTLDSIGDYAFRRCYNLSRVVSRIKTPFKISKSVFCYEDYWENNAQVFRNSPATLPVTRADFPCLSRVPIRWFVALALMLLRAWVMFI